MTRRNHPSVLFDHARTARIGLPEAVLCEGKPYGVLEDLLRSFGPGRGRPVLFTRLDPAVLARFEAEHGPGYDYDPVSRTAWGERLSDATGRGRVAVVSGGSADAPVAREAARTLEYLGFGFSLYEDSGVAGLWRLAGVLDEINSHEVVIVVAGLDAALASVLGGLTPRPVLAVPTSVGYGLARAGESALSSMLVSCAPGVCVHNIDNGYGAACAAARILNLLPAGPLHAEAVRPKPSPAVPSRATPGPSAPPPRRAPGRQRRDTPRGPRPGARSLKA